MPTIGEDDYTMFVRMLRSQYGTRARLYAVERRDFLGRSGDRDGAEVWKEVVRRLYEPAEGTG